MEAKNKFDQKEIQKKINELKELTSRVEKNFVNIDSLIMSTVEQNVGVWDGESAHQFKAKWSNLASEFPNLVDIFQKQVNNIELMIKKVEEVDAEK